MRLGILGDKATNMHGSSGYTNAQIGYIHEFGHAPIPKRSFLHKPILYKKQEILTWLYLNKAKITDLIAKGDMYRIYEILGVKCEQIVQTAFVTSCWNQWASLSKYTVIARKLKNKNDKLRPLIDTGQLRKSITSKVVKL